MTKATPSDTNEGIEIHRAVSDDGTEIAGRVHGNGPPLVLVHGGLEDGDIAWDAAVPFLSDRFTCYCMSTRGRGLSAEPSEPDYSPDRLVQDVTAFANSIGEPVCLAGHSSGAGLALGAAAQTDAVSAVAAYEPVVPQVVNEGDVARVQGAIARMGEAAAEGRLVDAARILFEDSPLGNDDDVAALSEAGFFEEMAHYVPINLQEQQQAAESEGPGFSDPSVLARITMPVLFLRGSRTSGAWATESGDYLAGHLADSRVGEIAGAGHFGPQFAPEAVADELVPFFEATPGK